MADVQARVTRGLTRNSAFAQQILNAGARVIQPELRAIGEHAVQIAEGIISTETTYGGKRPGRRIEGERHLSGSIDYRILGSTFPFKIEIFSHARGSKVGPLEFGSPAHPIAASRKPMLKFPGTNAHAGKWVSTKEVDHPGNRRIAFMKQGLDQAIATRFSRARAAR